MRLECGCITDGEFVAKLCKEHKPMSEPKSETMDYSEDAILAMLPPNATPIERLALRTQYRIALRVGDPIEHLKEAFTELTEAHATALTARDREVAKARTICEEIENYAMTANQSILDENPEVRKQIFRHIRDMARKGCAGKFESYTYSALQTAEEQIESLTKQLEDSQKELIAIWANCIVIYWPPDGSYYIEHNAAANKFHRDAIIAAITADKP